MPVRSTFAAASARGFGVGNGGNKSAPQTFSTAGTFSYVAGPGVYTFKIWGAGGGGGNGGSNGNSTGGGAGAIVAIVTVYYPETLTVNVGAGGGMGITGDAGLGDAGYGAGGAGVIQVRVVPTAPAQASLLTTGPLAILVSP